MDIKQGIAGEFIQNSVESIFFCNDEGKIVLWNKGSEYLFGYTTEEINSYSIFSLIDPGNLDSFNSLFESVAKERSLCFEIKCRTKGDELIDVEFTASNFRSGEDRILYFTARDISRIANMKSKLKEMYKSIEDKRELESKLESSNNRVKNTMSLLSSILTEIRSMDLGEETNLSPLASQYLRYDKDPETFAPTHLYVAIENEERMLEGQLYSKIDTEIQKTPSNIVLHPQEIKNISPERYEILVGNQSSSNLNYENFRKQFPINLLRHLVEVQNFAACRLGLQDRNGLIFAFNYPGEVTQEDAEPLRNISEAIGTILSLQYQFKEKMDIQFSMISKIAEFAEKRDLETAEHLKRIRNYVRVLAEEMAKKPKYKKIITREFIKKLYNAAPLHDIGKVGISDSILQKPGKLTETEHEAMRQHPQIGGQIFDGLSHMDMSRDIAFYHHEKYDGSGYPHGLKGEEIPLAARIVALADVYDAMTSKRSYKEPLSHERTKKLISICSGGHFDPDVVEAFLNREQDFVRIKTMYKG
jgi:PAS domain S-box-containing protein